MNKATKIALVTGDMRDCMSPASYGRRDTICKNTYEHSDGHGAFPRPEDQTADICVAS